MTKIPRHMMTVYQSLRNIPSASVTFHKGVGATNWKIEVVSVCPETVNLLSIFTKLPDDWRGSVKFLADGSCEIRSCPLVNYDDGWHDL